MDARIVAQLAGALLRWGSLGNLGSKTVRKEIRKVIRGVETLEDARAGAVARAKREILEEMGGYLSRKASLPSPSSSAGGESAAEDALALSSGVMQSEVVGEKTFSDGDRKGIRIVVKGQVGMFRLDDRVSRLLTDKMQLERIKTSERRNVRLIEDYADLERRNAELPEKGGAADRKALRTAFRQSTKRMDAQGWFSKVQGLWNGMEYTDAGQAIEYINQAIKLVPDYPVYYFFRGNANYYWKQYKPAMKDFGKAISLDAEYADAFNNRGNVHYQQGDFPRAIEDYGQAIQFDPRYADAFNNRGNAYFKQRVYAKALTEYDRAIALDAGSAVYLNNRGITHDGLRERDKALADYGEALRLDPTYAVAYNNRGMTHEVLERHSDALEDYKEAIRHDPKIAVAYYNRGRTFIKLGNSGAAHREWRKASKLGHKQAQENLRKG